MRSVAENAGRAFQNAPKAALRLQHRLWWDRTQELGRQPAPHSSDAGQITVCSSPNRPAGSDACCAAVRGNAQAIRGGQHARGRGSQVRLCLAFQVRIRTLAKGPSPLECRQTSFVQCDQGHKNETRTFKWGAAFDAQFGARGNCRCSGSGRKGFTRRRGGGVRRKRSFQAGQKTRCRPVSSTDENVGMLAKTCMLPLMEVS